MTAPPRSVSAWLAKADQDLAVAEQLAQLTDPYWDIVVFHAQQAVEKYLKALLIRHGSRPPKIHDLGKLLDIAQEHAPQLAVFRDDCNFLSPLAVVSRYPDYELMSPEADGTRGLEIARRVKAMVRPLIIPPAPDRR
jgi:HEPN domain-containing protein